MSKQSFTIILLKLGVTKKVAPFLRLLIFKIIIKQQR